ncbi:hypothetical protein DRP05_10190 [Archaeoglobales archaeon]|nr:MAG: hypothetical protein DRP05_10190 [Archaeoglobales archaeon]
MVEKRIVKIEEPLKRYVIQWQSWLQSKTGKYISQGRAVALACWAMLVAVDYTPRELRKRGLYKEADFFEALADEVVDVSKDLIEGELEEFDFESFFDRMEEFR